MLTERITGWCLDQGEDHMITRLAQLSTFYDCLQLQCRVETSKASAEAGQQDTLTRSGENRVLTVFDLINASYEWFKFLNNASSEVSVILNTQLSESGSVQLHIPGPRSAPCSCNLLQVTNVQAKLLTNDLAHVPLAHLLQTTPMIHSSIRVLQNQVSEYSGNVLKMGD